MIRPCRPALEKRRVDLVSCNVALLGRVAQHPGQTEGRRQIERRMRWMAGVIQLEREKETFIVGLD